MKNFIWAFIFLFVITACDPVEPVNVAADWTPEEQCQFYNKWALRADTVTGALHGLDASYLQHPPILMADRLTGQKIVGGICPGDAIGNYGLYNYYRQ